MYVYRGREVILEKKEEELTCYIRSEELLGAEKGEDYYHYSQDEQKSIRYIIKEKEIKNEYEYDAWGEVLRKEEEIENRFQYAGEQRDPISEQYYLRARYYNPAIGRFSQEDKYEKDGLNLYNYCKNNPLLYVDPSGNICEKAYNRLIDKGWENLSHNERKKVEAYERVRAKIEHKEKMDQNSYSEVRAESKRQQKEGKTREERKQDMDYLSRFNTRYTEEDRRNNKYPPRNLTAQRECQKVLNEVIRLKAQATGKDKNRPIVSVFTHEDGTVSVGISGNSEASAKFAEDLEKSLNKDGRRKYYVSGLATQEFKNYLKSHHVFSEDVKELGGKDIGFCAEPKAAIMANSNKSPITGMDTRNPRNNNRYSYEGIDKTSSKQMEPCTTCYLCEQDYMEYANEKTNN